MVSSGRACRHRRRGCRASTQKSGRLKVVMPTEMLPCLRMTSTAHWAPSTTTSAVPATTSNQYHPPSPKLVSAARTPEPGPSTECSCRPVAGRLGSWTGTPGRHRCPRLHRQAHLGDVRPALPVPRREGVEVGGEGDPVTGRHRHRVTPGDEVGMHLLVRLSSAAVSGRARPSRRRAEGCRSRRRPAGPGAEHLGGRGSARVRRCRPRCLVVLTL